MWFGSSTKVLGMAIGLVVTMSVVFAVLSVWRGNLAQSTSNLSPKAKSAAYLLGRVVVFGERKTSNANEIHESEIRSSEKAVRIIREGSMYTMDYRPDRLTVFVDKEGTVTRAEYF